VTLVKLQENKPCQLYLYQSIATKYGVNRWYINEFKINPSMEVKLSDYKKKIMKFKYGCYAMKSGTLFSKRFTNLQKVKDNMKLSIS